MASKCLTTCTWKAFYVDSQIHLQVYMAPYKWVGTVGGSPCLWHSGIVVTCNGLSCVLRVVSGNYNIPEVWSGHSTLRYVTEDFFFLRKKVIQWLWVIVFNSKVISSVKWCGFIITDHVGRHGIVFRLDLCWLLVNVHIPENHFAARVHCCGSKVHERTPVDIFFHKPQSKMWEWKLQHFLNKTVNFGWVRS